MDFFIQFWTENRDTISGIGGVIIVLVGMYIQDKRPDLLPIFNKSKEQIQTAAKQVDQLVVLLDAIKLPNQEIKQTAQEQGLAHAAEKVAPLPE